MNFREIFLGCCYHANLLWHQQFYLGSVQLESLPLIMQKSSLLLGAHLFFFPRKAGNSFMFLLLRLRPKSQWICCKIELELHGCLFSVQTLDTPGLAVFHVLWKDARYFCSIWIFLSIHFNIIVIGDWLQI